MTETRKLRLSPSGPFAGDPGLRIGPGSTGVVFRKHGVGDSSTAMNVEGATATAPIDGLTFDADLQPGYKYDVRVYAEYQGQGLTVVAQVHAVYRTRVKATQSWTDWARVTPSSNCYVQGDASTDPNPTGSWQECLTDLAVTATADAIEFGLVSNYSSGQPAYRPSRSFAVVSEYIP